MTLVEPTTIPLPSSPHSSIGNISDVTNSLISVRLSEPITSQKPIDDAESESVGSDTTVEPESIPHRRSSFDIMHGVDMDLDAQDLAADEAEAIIIEDDDDGADSLGKSSRQESVRTDTVVEEFPSIEHSRTSSCSSRDSRDSTPVDWSELDNKEESEQREEGADDVSIAAQPYSTVIVLTSSFSPLRFFSPGSSKRTTRLPQILERPSRRVSESSLVRLPSRS